MNFFEQQHNSKVRTLKIISIYFICIAVLVLMLGVVATLLFSFFATADEQTTQSIGFLQQLFSNNTLIVFKEQFPVIFMLVTLITVPAIFIKTLFTYFSYRSNGGHKIAQSMGGTLLTLNGSETLQERRLLNVVSEIGIASSIGEIPVYVLRGDNSINAFAAGTKKENMVIGVTNGAIEHLTRDEMQGVIAHEMGHVFNNDMKINLQISSLIHGLMVLTLIGYALWPSSLSRVRNNNENNKKFVIAAIIGSIVLIAAGYIGSFAGRIVQAAVSREREYLADASAVQYTRNTEGIASALEKISEVNVLPVSNYKGKISANAHFFFSKPVFNGFEGIFSSGIWSTHPPLDERINRIRGTSN